jgi:hypothetical protein
MAPRDGIAHFAHHEIGLRVRRVERPDRAAPGMPMACAMVYGRGAPSILRQ